MKYLHWRGDSLYCRYPLPGKPHDYPLGIRTIGTEKDRRRCMADGERALASLRTKVSEGTFFDMKRKEAPREYNPKYWRIVGRYWYNHLRFQKTGQNERHHLAHSLREFGRRSAKQIFREDIERWRNEMKAASAAVNTVNNRYAYLGRAYSYANSESNPAYRLGFDPTIGMKKMTGGKVRQFLLTPQRFERNYEFLCTGRKRKGEKPNKHMTEWETPPAPRFALFYLGLWETGRRPDELSLYTWEMVTELEIDGLTCRVFMVPSEITKTEDPQPVPISDRLWREMSQLAYRHGSIFRNEKGSRWQYWDRHIEKLKVEFGEHEAGWARDCRRGFVTRKTELDGCDPEHVRQCTGHKTDAIFRRYRIGELRNLIGVVKAGIGAAPHTNCTQFGKTA